MPQSGAAVSASDKAGQYALGYFLPKGRAAAGFSQRLVRCPTVDQPEILVEARAQIVGKSVPDYARLYRIDTRAGPLVKRQTDLLLYPNGTIKGVNATVEGQGAAVIQSVVKLAGFAISVASGGGIMSAAERSDTRSQQLQTRCRAAIAELIRKRNAQAETIAGIEAQLAADGTLTESEADELSYQRERLAVLDDALTLSSDPAIVDPSGSTPVRLPGLDYSQWFEATNRKDIARLPGDDGVLVEWTVNAAAQSALTAAAYVKPADVAALSTEPAAVLYYRRPVPVAITVTPCTRSDAKKSRDTLAPETEQQCAVDSSPVAAALATDATVGFPQLSGLFRLPIGRGGLFGSRSVAAEFDEAGAPVALKYGSDPGAADIAATLDAVREAGGTLRDARKEALARKAAMLQSRKDIRDLEDALDE